MAYDRKANEANAKLALSLLGDDLSWFRLDDGVMGGRSETLHGNESGKLHFTGTINTDGGGFCSIRARIPKGVLEKSTNKATGDESHDKSCSSRTKGIRLTLRGDGKTYKLLLSDGERSAGGPTSRSPSWQVDIPTKKNKRETITVPVDAFQPAFGGRPSSRPSKEDMAKFRLDLAAIQEIGLMLSLRLSDGSPNPKETFGEGIFPFSLLVESIEIV